MGLDLDDWFRGLRHWDTLPELVDELPTGSLYRSAVADDDEFVAAIIEHDPTALDDNNLPKRPPLDGWDNYRADLAEIKDLVNTAISAIARSETPPRPVPRPETAFDRARKQQRQERTDYLTSAWGIE